MKTLTLLRHAKSGWDDSATRDFDRTLNPKGRRAAQTIGRQWRSLDLSFDHLVASPARRVHETLAEVAAGYGRPLEPEWERGIYLAEADTLLDLVRGFPPAAEKALMAGHSPGLERLVLMLAAPGELYDEVEDKYPTASVAELSFPGEWSVLAPGRATLVRFTRPRDLDPTLGPDEE